jgi:hypothetical protein
MWRKMEKLRDRILFGCGTEEPWFLDDGGSITAQWRKPLRIDEVNQLAPTPDVRQREGRP